MVGAGRRGCGRAGRRRPVVRANADRRQRHLRHRPWEAAPNPGVGRRAGQRYRRHSHGSPRLDREQRSLAARRQWRIFLPREHRFHGQRFLHVSGHQRRRYEQRRDGHDRRQFRERSSRRVSRQLQHQRGRDAERRRGDRRSRQRLRRRTKRSDGRPCDGPLERDGDSQRRRLIQLRARGRLFRHRHVHVSSRRRRPQKHRGDRDDHRHRRQRSARGDG